MTVTVVEHEHEHHEPEPEHDLESAPHEAAAAIVEGAQGLAQTVTDTATAAAEQARVEALDVEALRREIRDQVEAEYLARKAETEAAVASALAAVSPEPEPEAEPDTDDKIAPHKSHPWFRSPGEWFGDNR